MTYPQIHSESLDKKEFEVELISIQFVPDTDEIQSLSPHHQNFESIALHKSD